MISTQPTLTVLARYLTLAGQALGNADINVTITETGPRDGDRALSTVSVCSGCRAADTTCWDTYPYRQLSDRHEFINVTQAAEEAERAARRWAREHAEACRELPTT